MGVLWLTVPPDGTPTYSFALIFDAMSLRVFLLPAIPATPEVVHGFSCMPRASVTLVD